MAYLDEDGLRYLISQLYDIFSTKDNLRKEICLLEKNYDSIPIVDALKINKTGKIYTAKVWKSSANPTSDCVKMDDNVGLQCVPSTDTVEGIDDYANIPLFTWRNCNYVRDSYGCARLTYLEGEDGYSTSGSADVGVISPMMFIKHTEETDYDLWSISDTQHDNTWVPWYEGITYDESGNTIVLPYYIGSKYYSGYASDNKLRSQPGLTPAATNYQIIYTEYPKKGAGYWGAGAERNLFHILMSYIKYGTKHSQSYCTGCCNYDHQYNASIVSEDANTYFPLTKVQASNLVVGSSVSIGYGSTSADRGTAATYSICENAKILSITDLDENNSAVYLDVGTPFNTQDNSSDAHILLSTVPYKSGSTDTVIGHHDGSLGSNSDMKHPYRIQGREYAIGGGYVFSNYLSEYDSTNNVRIVYVAPRGVDHSNMADTVRSTYTNVGAIPGYSGNSYNIGDLTIDLETGSYYPSSSVSTDEQGFCDKAFYIRSNLVGQSYTLGSLTRADYGGQAYFNTSTKITQNYWYYFSAD